jgi:AraC family transcriptional regulator of arabinose operon
MAVDHRQATANGIALYRPRAEMPSVGGLACTGFGMQRIARWVTDRVLDDYAAVYVDAGAGWLETAALGRRRIQAPALFWLAPGIHHSYGPDEGTAWHEHWVIFTGDGADALQAAGLIDPLRAPYELAETREIAGLFGMIHSDFLDDHPLGPASAAAALQRLIVRAARLAEGREAGARPQRLTEAVAALRERAFKPVDLVAFARAFELSPATFRRQMVANQGLSPKAFVQQLRIGRAKEMLAVTTMSIEEIARTIGFDDPYYFSRLFAAKEGLPPSEFRRRNQRS